MKTEFNRVKQMIVNNHLLVLNLSLITTDEIEELIKYYPSHLIVKDDSEMEEIFNAFTFNGCVINRTEIIEPSVRGIHHDRN